MGFPALAGLSADNTLGAMYLGAILEGCMYGVTTLQSYTYYGRCSADSRYLKAAILLLWLIDTVHAALITSAVYTYLVTDSSNFLALLKPAMTVFPATVIMMAINGCLVRGILCYRIWRLSDHNWYLAVAIATASLVTFSSTTVYGALGTGLPSWFDLHRFTWLYIFCFSWSIAADILIAASLTVMLVKRRTGFSRSDSILTTLAVYSINTGILNSLYAMVCLLTYVIMPNNLIFLGLCFVYPKMILNCLLATLNARSDLRTASSSGRTASSSGLDSSQLSRRRSLGRDARLGGLGTRSRPDRQEVVINIGLPSASQEAANSGWLGSDNVDSEAGKGDIELRTLGE